MSGRSLIADYRSSAKRPAFWIYSTWLDLATKYRRSSLGLLWALIPPALYAFGVGTFFAQLQGWDLREFVSHIAIGYVIFRFVTVSLSEATTACSAHASFILDGRVRLTDYVLRVIAKASFYLVMAAPVIVVGILLGGEMNITSLLLSVIGMLLIIFNILWMGIIFAVIGARFSDINELIGTAIMVAFLFTPLLWTAEQVPVDTLRGVAARLNPLFHMVEIFRAPLLGRSVEIMTVAYLVFSAIVGWLFASFVYRRYAHFVPLWV